MQNEEAQRPATARPSLLSAGPGQGETLNILSELDGKTGHAAAAAGRGVRPGRRELVTWTVLVLAAMGCTAAMVLRDVSTMEQVGAVSQRMALGAADGQGSAPSGGDQVAAAGAMSEAGAGSAPAVAANAAMAAPAAEKPSTAATIIDTPQALAEPAPVRKAVAKARKAAPAKERRTRVAKAKAPEQKVAKVKTHKKPASAPQKPQAAPDSDVELLAALVAHTKPQQGGRAAPCPPAEDKSAGMGAACGAGHKQ